MGFELGVVKLLDGVLHVLVSHELTDAGAVLEHLGLEARSSKVFISPVLPDRRWLPVTALSQ